MSIEKSSTILFLFIIIFHSIDCKSQNDNGISVSKEMHSMHSYPEFPDDVINIFEQIIIEHNFKVKHKNIASVVLENKYLELCFSMDRYDLMTLIKQKKIRPVRVFGITQIILHLNPQWKETEEFNSFRHHGYGESAISTLGWYEKYTSKYLENVLNGDFSWSEELFRKDNCNIKYIDFIYKNFEEENEIRNLYEDGNGNWMPKLFKYLEENNIKIK